jgi:hypothetical protein
VRSREVDAGDHGEEDEGLFFVLVEEEQEEAGDEVEGLAVAYRGIVHSKGLQYTPEGTHNGDFGFGRPAAGVGRGGIVGFEAGVVRECAMEIAFNVFAVVVTELSSLDVFEQPAVHLGVFHHKARSTRIPPPSCSAPLWWDALADVSLDFVALGWEANGLIGVQAVRFHECVPLLTSAVQMLAVFSIPFVVCLYSDMV